MESKRDKEATGPTGSNHASAAGCDCAGAVSAASMTIDGCVSTWGTRYGFQA